MTISAVELLASPFMPVFERFIDSIESRCFIASPYITLSPVRRLVETLAAKPNPVTVTLLTDLSLPNMVQGATDIDALLYLCDTLPNLHLRYLPALHAKVCIADNRFAVIGSANFTTSGAQRNFEYGISTSDPLLVQRISDDMATYSNLGNSVSCDSLRVLKTRVDMLRDAVREERTAISQKIKAARQEIERQTQDDLIRIQVKGRTIHAIFVHTVLYLLRSGSLTTEQIYEGVQSLHPDLCDETQDRVIDGRHFGRLWKHQVRTAQVTLKRKNQVIYDAETRLWTRTT